MPLKPSAPVCTIHRQQPRLLLLLLLPFEKLPTNLRPTQHPPQLHPDLTFKFQ